MSGTPPGARERVGFGIAAKNASDALGIIREAEAAGVRQVWSTAGGVPETDSLSFFAVAASETSKIRLGTSITQIYTRHPMVTAQQTRLIDELAPGRFRLGVGPSHREIMERRFGLEMRAPLAYLREYVAVLRGALWDGRVDHHGRFFDISFDRLAGRAPVPIMVSALGVRAYRHAGEISDGAISWMCPVPYLLGRAVPTLREGAAAARRPVPPVVAQVPVALSTDGTGTKVAAVAAVKRYVGMKFYTNMFTQAGFQLGDGAGLDALADSLVVAGDEQRVRQKLLDLLATGLDELLVMQLSVADEEDERRRLLGTIGSL